MTTAETVKRQENFWDRIEQALWICDADDIAPIDTCAKLHKEYGDGDVDNAETAGLIITTTDGKKFRVTAEEIA